MQKNRKILIIGNGPSTQELAEWGLENLRSDVDTFGMGIAYRFFQEINWWPTLYACGDSKVVFSHRKELGSIVENPDVPTDRFYFSWPVSEHSRLELITHCSTGDFCFRKSLELRYREIYLIGIEGHYIEKIMESRPLTEDEYLDLGFEELKLSELNKSVLRIITKTPDDNPNYFFHGYQQAGDVYSLPSAHRHRSSWKEAAEYANSSDVKVLNLSGNSRLSDFPKTTLINQFDRVLNSDAKTKQNRPSGLLRASTATDNDFGAAPVVTHNATGQPDMWFGPFEREHKKRIEEENVIIDLFRLTPSSNPVPIMIDIGACQGRVFHKFAREGWWIHAFEPNPPFFKALAKKYTHRKIVLNDTAVSDVEGAEVPFYTSEESHGISSLQAFRPTHEVTAHVKTVRLDNYLFNKRIKRIEFLKIDTEGYDLMVLQGLNLAKYPVSIILCEFEDSKSKPLGYSWQDQADYLNSYGYTVYVSEWHPVITYGGPHQWRILKRYPCELEDPNAWGNFLAFKSDPGFCAVAKAFNNCLRRNDKLGPRRAGAVGPKTLDRELRAAQSRIRSLQLEKSEVFASKSWKFTYPLRLLNDIANNIFRRNGGSQ